jgi:phosphoribosylanthranilate isomerase
MTRIKMCGITRSADAELAVALGVNALGFVLWPGSPRHIRLDDAARIIAALPPYVTAVGVFVNPGVEAVRRAAEEAGIVLAQIHGDLPTWEGGRPPVRVLRAVHLAAGDGAIEPACGAGEAVLLDAHDPVKHGGTGRPVDWGRAARVARGRPVMLAGGLTPANVAEAIRVVRPYGVDVASGIEMAPGVKDPELMRMFVEAVKETP